jgi:hypothetical protein
MTWRQNETCREACQIGKELEALSRLKNLRKVRQAAILASSESLEGIERFPFPAASWTAMTSSDGCMTHCTR